jgi:hypothetical protein
MDILAGTATAFSTRGGAMIVQLQGDTDDIMTGALEERRGNGRVHPARHRHDNPSASATGNRLHCRIE